MWVRGDRRNLEAPLHVKEYQPPEDRAAGRQAASAKALGQK